ncbi:Atypical/ABC1/ABC1-B protein kinase [Paracoccidioides brasiliensis]|uniref:Atypical/ABC1/ABC1-B protein kinase n=1 Tax=Paracoccidioides brasiliensis TaxID=121759 RepID=A0A1D2JFG3_PARBR|nr:Atypical/ABC1/ABC1-B protein kinase [Paracoccidioides brasiliensis]ODH50057.1 Atypical/ABC1/ABC1-B protein kinase [Paracoccidioides brasiliensis]
MGIRFRVPATIPFSPSGAASSSSSLSNPLPSHSSRLPQWTCRQCLQQRQGRGRGRGRGLQTSRFPSREYAATTRFQTPNDNGGSANKRRPKRALKYAAAGGTVGATLFAFSDDVKHVYSAAERTGRVMTALAVCINDYRKTLNRESDFEEEKTLWLKACHKRCAMRTLRVLEKNGSIFIKLGQHLSSMGYLLPLEWTTTFIPLQDKCPVSSFESIEDMFVKDTGHTIDELFSSFDRVPIGAASLAQVHVGVLRETGQKVAVKVQHPALAEWVPLDLSLTRFTFLALKKFFPEYDLEWLSEEMEFSLPQELDFRMEAENARRAGEYFRKKQTASAPLVIPEVMWAKKRILVMDFISGHRPDDLEYLDSNSIDRDEVSAALAHIFNEMIFGDGAPLHCDPHGGNIAVRKNDSRRKPNFDIILYDHGLYRDISTELRRNYAKLWLAVINSDEAGMRKYSYKVAGVTDDQFPLFASAITGRDYTVLANKDVVSSRSAEEKEAISGALGDGLLQELVSLLGKVPRIILLILKTNDLTRSLDENLHTRHGPLRTFLILAKYATCTVFEEQMEVIRQHGSILWPRNFIRLLQAWASYLRVELKLEMYEHWLSIRGRLGLIN